MSNNYVDALGDVIFSSYSHAPLLTWTDTEANTLVQSGETIANAKAEAFFYDSELSELYAESTGVGIEGVYQGSATSEAQIVAGFSVEAGETFSFDFLGDLLLEAKEIDNPVVEYNEAQLNMGFLLLDTSNPNRPRVLDYADIWGSLISSEQVGELKVNFSNNFTLDTDAQSIDLDGNNDVDYITSTTTGTYERTFKNDTNLTLLKVNQSVVRWLGDSAIGNLGEDFIYGTVKNDRLRGTSENDKVYASFGDDFLNGGNGNDNLKGGLGKDSLKGGFGADRLLGGQGDDSLTGNFGADRLLGGQGDDSLTGGFGADRFLYQTPESFTAKQIGVDVITDLEVNTDKIVLSQKTFNDLTLTNEAIDADEFAVVDNDELAAISQAFITYSNSTGNLFYNQNGSDDGLGQGSQFITLQNTPILTATDFLVSD